MLALRAIETRPLRDAHLAQRRATAWAGFAGAAVDAQPAGEIAGVAVFLDEVPQGGAALDDGGIEHGPDGLREAPVTLQPDAVTGA